MLIFLLYIYIYFISVFFFNYLSFSFSSSYDLFKPSNCITTIIIIIIITTMFIDITVKGALDKSSGGEFQARNSSGMIYTYSLH